MTNDMNLPTKVAAWFLMVALGPLHFAGEMVGPTGGFSWRQWFAAFVGTVLWVAFFVEVLSL